MGIKDILSRWAEKNTEKKKQFKEMEEQYLLQKKLEDRQKSSNERELERYLKEQREERIKKELEHFRKKQKNDLWHNSFLLKKDNSMLKNDKPILKEKNIFSLKGTMFQRGNMLDGSGGGYFK